MKVKMSVCAEIFATTLARKLALIITQQAKKILIVRVERHVQKDNVLTELSCAYLKAAIERPTWTAAKLFKLSVRGVDFVCVCSARVNRSTGPG